MWSYFTKGGMMMWPLLLFSIAALAIIIERFLFFYKVTHVDARLIEKLRQAIEKKDIDEALKLCGKYRSPVTSIIKKGLEGSKESREAMKHAMEQAELYEVPRLEKYLGMLSAIASTATLVGFTGTVLGMIRAFNSIAASGVSSPTVVAKGISEALITTATGLLIAAPTMLFYYYFTHRSDRIINQIEQATKEMSVL